MKVYQAYTGRQANQGRGKCYDDEFYHLHHDTSRVYYSPTYKERRTVKQNPIFNRPTNDYTELEYATSRGRQIIVELYRWNDLLLRGTKDCTMSDKPFDVIAARCIDKKTGELIFKKDQFIGLWGKQRTTYDTAAAFKDYRHRYDIEVHNRFSKQQLLLDKYLTANIAHLDAWAWVVAIAYWLLFVASFEVKACPTKWQQYLPKYKEALASKSKVPLSAAMTRKAANNFFSNFDLKPFAPKVRINGKGRKKGTKLVARPKRKPQKKDNKARQKTKIKLISEKLE